MANTIHDITFVVAVTIDSDDRLANYEYHKKYWKDAGVKVIYEEVDYDPNVIFHRTKLLNQGIVKVTTTNVAITDVDCIFDVSLLRKSLHAVDEHNAIIPFNRVKHIDLNHNVLFEWANPPHMNRETLNRYFYKEKFNSFIDFENITNPYFNFDGPTGLCFIANTESYKKCGMENKNCIDYAFEDIERIVRVRKLGMNVTWINNIGYHLHHSPDSRKRNKLFRNNFFEFLKVCDMEKDELESYVETWKN